MPVPSLSPAPGILHSFLQNSIDEGNIGAARTPSWAMKTGIKLLQDKVDIEHWSMPRVVVLQWKWVMLPPYSPLFPIAFLIESSHECCALCWTQHCLGEHARCDLNTDSTGIGFLWGHSPKVPSLEIENNLSVQNSHWAAKLSRSWKGGAYSVPSPQQHKHLRFLSHLNKIVNCIFKLGYLNCNTGRI